MGKKMSYIDLLKEAVTNYPSYDTSQTTDVSGPFVDDIVSYEGDGEMVTYKDASSILEKYYFDKDEGIENIHEQHDEEAAGNSDGGTIDKEKEEIVSKMTEQEEKEDEEDEEDEKEEVEESEDLNETEKSIVEKLIEEMEEEQPAGKGDAEKYIPEAEEKDKDEEEEEGEKEEDEEDLDVDKELEEWGTGILEEDEMDDEEEDEKEEKEEMKEGKDKDKKGKKKTTNEAGPVGGPLGKNKSSGIKKGQYDDDEEDADMIEEQFSLFKKQIMESDDKSDDVEDIDGKDVIV